MGERSRNAAGHLAVTIFPPSTRFFPSNPDSLHEFVFPEVGEHITVIAENVAREELDAVLVTNLVDFHHHVAGTAG